MFLRYFTLGILDKNPLQILLNLLNISSLFVISSVNSCPNAFLESICFISPYTGFFFHIWENLLSPFKKVVCIAAFEVLLSSYIIILDVINFSLYNYSGSIEGQYFLILPCSQKDCKHAFKRKIALFLYTSDKIQDFCSHTYIVLEIYIFILARTYLQPPIWQRGAGNVYLLVLFSCKVNIAKKPIAVMEL